MVYQPVNNISLYTSYNRSFQPLADSFVFYKNSDDLRPTKTENYEIGAKWDVNDQLNVTLALFEMSQTNIQNQDPANPNQALFSGLPSLAHLYAIGSSFLYQSA